jgi:L-ascorbate metabolism protein UlaG (beta-lactamase superfamily)
MKAAFQKDGALLDDIQAALRENYRRLWWLGQSGFLLVQKGRAVLLDPYLSDSLTRKYAETNKPHVRMTERVIDPAQLGSIGVIDVVTSSHVHTDHLDSETLLPILKANAGAKLVCPEANLEVVTDRLGAEIKEQFLPADAGRNIVCGEVKLTGIPAAHNDVERDSAGHCKFLGFVLEWEGFTVYHSGDTLLHLGLLAALRPYSIDLALLPINGNRAERRVAGNLSGVEAAQLAHNISAKLVIPCHFDMFEFNTEAPLAFTAECRRLDSPLRSLRTAKG